MINSVFINSKNQIIDISKDHLLSTLNENNGLLWVNLDKPTDEELLEILQDIFHFHPLTIEDCQSQGFQTAKVDDHEDYLFIITHTLKSVNDFEKLTTDELNIFLGSNFVVTSHQADDMHPIQCVWELLAKDDRIATRGADFLCHAILDVVVDDYLPLIDKMDEEIDWLEDMVLEKPNPQTLQRILSLKHSTLTLRRIIAPQREIMNILSRDDFRQIQDANKIYFRDIYDHLVRFQDLSESVRDIVSGTLDIYLSATSNRLNEVMKALTIVSTIFLPLTFIAGVYGMNFHHFPELTWKFGYLYVWILYILIVFVMIWYFKKRKWF
jgi:magnesium transporter